uniref:Ankyrin-3-like n=1 Tax=Saccoglossus kowalevskii TaxID=10224 RepID=A0ABM0GXA6_SACKO|nr:PREDICTED: ankyrin-3-like [Saccoglossus kowalevskii]
MAEVGNTELINLINSGVSASELELKICEGADVNCPGKMGLAPLHHAVYEGNLDCVKLLLCHNADVNVQDHCGYSPLHLAAKYKRIEILQELILKGADVHSRDAVGFPPLRLALQAGNHECAAYLLRKGANPNMYYKHFGYEVHMVNLSNAECLELLLQFGADPDAHDSRGLTALHIACQDGNVGFVQRLLKYNADIDAKSANPSKENSTPLRYAVLEDEKEITELLLLSGADPNEPDGRSNTPLHHAATQGNIEMAKLLLKYGSNVSAKNEMMNEPLHQACRYSHDPLMIDLLLQHGADPNSVTSNKETPLLLLLWKYGRITKYDVEEIDRELKMKIGYLFNFGAKVRFTNDRVDPFTLLHAKLNKLVVLTESMLSLAEFAQEISVEDDIGNVSPDMPSEILTQLRFVKSNPKSLKHMTRLCIRNSLGERCQYKIHKLPLPQPLVKFVQYL